MKYNIKVVAIILVLAAATLLMAATDNPSYQFKKLTPDLDEFKTLMKKARKADPKYSMDPFQFGLLAAVTAASTEIIYVSQNCNWIINRYYNPLTNQMGINLIGVDSVGELMLLTHFDDKTNFIVWSMCKDGTPKNNFIPTLQVDKNKSYTGNDFINKQNEIISEMKTGKVVNMKTGCVSWQDESLFVTISLEGFEEVYNEFETIISLPQS